MERYKELNDKYKNLIKDSSKKTLIFDVCAHSGETLSKIKKTLKKSGFDNLKTGTVVGPENNCSYPDFCLTKESKKGCYPFGHDYSVFKTSGSVVSTMNKRKRRIRKGRKLRKEIKKIIEYYVGMA